MVQYLKAASRTWDVHSECGIFGDSSDTHFVNTIPGNESRIPSLAIWLRATGVLPSDFRGAGEIKSGPASPFPTLHEHDELMDYAIGGLMFLPTLDEMYGLIKFGEQHFLNEWASVPEERSRFFSTWKSTELSKDWPKKNKASDDDDKGTNIFECFLLYVHRDIVGYHVYRPGTPHVPLYGDGTPPVYPDKLAFLKINRHNPDAEREMETVYFDPRYTTDPATQEKEWTLPHDCTIEYTEKSTEDYKRFKIDDGGLKALRYKLHLESVPHAMMNWKTLDRLKSVGWAFDEYLQKVFEAIEWYLVLAESHTPSDMWDKADRRPNHINVDLPLKPTNASTQQRINQFDRRLYNSTMIEWYRWRAEQVARHGGGYGDEHDDDGGGGGAGSNAGAGSYTGAGGNQGIGGNQGTGYTYGDNPGGYYYATGDGSLLRVPHGTTIGSGHIHTRLAANSELEVQEDDAMQPSSSPASVEPSVPHSSTVGGDPQDVPTKSLTIRRSDCNHSDCLDTLHQISLHFAKLVDEVGEKFETSINEKGFSEALSLMRTEKFDIERFDRIKRMKSHKNLLLTLVQECSGIVDGSNGECKLRAMQMNLLLDGVPKEERHKRMKWATLQLRIPRQPSPSPSQLVDASRISPSVVMDDEIMQEAPMRDLTMVRQ